MAESLELPGDHALETGDSSAATDVFNSVKVSIADLCAKGTAAYAHKNYDDASDMFARASELQAELNGEMLPENAEILFLYGRSMFKVGQSKSDVLGGRASGEKKKPNGAPKSNNAEPKPVKNELDTVAEEGVAIIAEQNSTKTEADGSARKPLFQFTGDENFEDSDSDEEDAEGDGDVDEEEEDFAVAFEILDIARVLYNKKLEEPEEGASKGKALGDSTTTKHVKERLADTHDLLAEISLENERFPGAVTDFRSALLIKQDLYPEESEIIAEAHYKLSLALEFASITRTEEDGEESKGADDEAHVDQAMRDEAAKELEAAIKSTKLKLHNQEVVLAESSSPDDNDLRRAVIADVKEMVADMETRLAELSKPPVDVKDVLYGPTSGSNPMGSVLGTTLGETPADAAARIEEAKKTATDLTGLVRKKVKAEATPEPTARINGNGKRKVDDHAEDSEAKKAKV